MQTTHARTHILQALENAEHDIVARAFAAVEGSAPRMFGMARALEVVEAGDECKVSGRIGPGVS